MDAKKDRRGEDEAAQLLEGMTRLIVAKGKKVLEWDLTKQPPTAEEIRKNVLGPSGNLRAPTAVRGKTVLVGFNDDVYDSGLN